MSYHNNDKYKGLVPVNGIRVVRKYIERLTDQELHELWEATKDDTSHEGMVIYYLITIILYKRKETDK